ncbi:hypothetical protein Tsubulata_022909 [Turnera subulata]|uniref:mitogen-activated protein kinase kinase kinase n=1 Tax=Turnera subulata TaxID=218843 RepID=A0A9Q0FVF1_9ROSI|nr:hypothetical protein Tsubulata_022909 [Turnera subulata]
MHLFRKTSSLPSSPSPSPTNGGGGSAGNSPHNRGRSRKLERQKKLRYVSAYDFGLQSSTTDRDRSNRPDRPRSPPGSPRKQQQCPSRLDHLCSPSSALPQPLPLPDAPLTRRTESSGLTLPPILIGSPENDPGSVLKRDGGKDTKSSSNFRERFSQFANVESGDDFKLSIPARSAPATGFSSPNVSPPRSNGSSSSAAAAWDFYPFGSNFVADTPKPSTNLQRRLSHDSNIDNGYRNFRRDVASPRSAPTSGFSSPVVSPQRSSTGDYPPPLFCAQDFQLWSEQAKQSSPAKTMHSPDRSPRSSPLRSPRRKPQSPNNKFSFPLHCKLFQGSSKEWPESSRVSAHPLPLPPGASPSHSSVVPPSPAPSIHHATEMSNGSQRNTTTQWVKGRLLGCGTYGKVYVGTHRETGAYCAMKEVDVVPDDPKSVECIKQLEQEIRVLQHLKHPNIVQYYGSEVVDDHFYIYLEYVHPGSINKYIHEHCGHMTESIVRNFTRHIVSGLAYLHSTKTIHRDIKGANLLVDACGIVKLADFGMAKHLSALSYELSLKGSPHWMAPEVLKAVMRNDASPDLALAVDIWSLGCTVIEMFTGKPPWGEIPGVQAMFSILNKAPPVPETLSPEGKDFLHCCLRKNPAERPSAVMLLEHPFVRNANDPKMSACRQAISAISLKAIGVRSVNKVVSKRSIVL